MNGDLKKMKELIKTYDQFEVVKVPFPFSDMDKAKIRPALVLSSAKQFNAKVGLSVMAMITSLKSHRDHWSVDIIIKDLELAGLPVPSIVRFKLFTLDHRLILGRLGNLSEIDRDKVRQNLKNILVI